MPYLIDRIARHPAITIMFRSAVREGTAPGGLSKSSSKTSPRRPGGRLPPRPCSSSSAPGRTRSGWLNRSSWTATASSSPAPTSAGKPATRRPGKSWAAIPICSKPACRECSQSATCVATRSNVASADGEGSIAIRLVREHLSRDVQAATGPRLDPDRPRPLATPQDYGKSTRAGRLTLPSRAAAPRNLPPTTSKDWTSRTVASACPYR